MRVVAPVSGIVFSLEQVPDEVFSKKMVGDGVAIDPVEGVLYSPIAGRIEFIHASKHALTVKSSDGLEILMHIGLETVQMKGEGFTLRCKAGDTVSVGQNLIEFDMDLVATKAKSCLTMVVVSNGSEFPISNWNSKRVVTAGQDEIFAVDSAQFTATNTSTSAAEVVRGNEIACVNATGLHARPAAVLVAMAKKFSSEISLNKGSAQANAKSVVSILSLEVENKDLISVSARGSDAAVAVKELTALIASGLGEAHQETAKPKVAAEPSKVYHVVRRPSSGAPTSANKNEIFGVTAAPGLVLGEILVREDDDILVKDTPSQKIDIAAEKAKLEKALIAGQAELRALLSHLAETEGPEKASIFEAHLELLQDPELSSLALQSIDNKKSAAYSWQKAYLQISAQLAQLRNDLLAARAADVQDVGKRVLRILLGKKANDQTLTSNSQRPTILVAKHLTPSDMVAINPDQVKAICTVEGGATSHVAILARAMNMAALTALPESILQLKSGEMAVVDSKKSMLLLSPTEDQIKNIQEKSIKKKAQAEKDLAASQSLALTEDGHRVEIFANLGNVEEAEEAVRFGAEGVGLLRSEFLFLHRASEPDESEQLECYQQIVSALQTKNAQRPVIIRTLDVGGDKPLPYIALDKEENPFLGIRGLRLSLLTDDMFRMQIRALLSVKPFSQLRIMLPMVTSLHELLEAKQIIQEEEKQMGVGPVSLGIMIEVPSAAIMAETFAPHVDFFSIGSNDLTQYTMAIDRGHRDLAAMADGLHPSVLRLIQLTVQAAHKFGKYVGVCGGIAGDFEAVPLLIGLGVDELSVSVPSIPSIKAQVRKLRKSACEELATQALQLAEASEVRALVSKLLASTGD
jgi:phosphoenolpyruvate-protein phosphotransferase